MPLLYPLPSSFTVGKNDHDLSVFSVIIRGETEVARIMYPLECTSKDLYLFYKSHSTLNIVIAMFKGETPAKSGWTGGSGIGGV